MLNLILNENMKIYRRLRTWILIALMVIVVGGILVIINSTTKPSKDENAWKAETSQNIVNMKMQLSSRGMPAAAKKEIESQIIVSQYRLDNNIPPHDSLWNGVMQAADFIVLVTMLTVIIAADMVAGEFSTGTIKMLLIRPANRSKILLSKYLATLLFSFLLLVLLFATAFVIYGLYQGFSGMNDPYIYASSDGIVNVVNMVPHVLSTYGYQCIGLIMIVTLAFMISTVFRSSALAITLSLLFLFIGPAIAFFLSRYDWVKYFLFANTDLTQYLRGQPLVEGMTLQFSIMVLIAYFIIFNALTWTIFNKRDVAA